MPSKYMRVIPSSFGSQRSEHQTWLWQSFVSVDQISHATNLNGAEICRRGSSVERNRDLLISGMKSHVLTDEPLYNCHIATLKGTVNP